MKNRQYFMCNPMKNRHVAYLALHVLYVLQSLLNLASYIVSSDYSKIRKNVFIIITILYAGFIFYLSSQSDISVPSAVFNMPILYEFAEIAKDMDLVFLIDIAKYAYENVDKLAHMVLYFGLGILLHLTFRNSENTILRKYAAIFAVLLGVIYGITDEFHQSFVPGRTSSLHDLLADGIGVTIAQVIFVILVLISMQRKKSNKDQE